MGERLHRKLEVWKRAIKLVKKIYDLSYKFPSSEKFVLSSQIRRAALSVPSNIAEGSGRHNIKERLQFFNIAQGSLSELDTHVEIAYELNYLEKADFDEIISDVSIISKQLYNLSRRIKSRNSE